MTIFPGGVDHYTFLDVCTAEGRSALPALCVDHPGVDRAAIHDAVANLADQIFRRPSLAALARQAAR